MAQNDFGTIDPNTKSGTALATDLNNFRDAVNSVHLGGTRPSYVVTGMIWGNNTSSNLVYSAYDGSDDIALFQLDATNNVVRAVLDLDQDSWISCRVDDEMSFVLNGNTRFTVLQTGLKINHSAFDFIFDLNDNELLELREQASAVNHIGIRNAATGNAPIIEARGDNTNIDLKLAPKGTGLIDLSSGFKVGSDAQGDILYSDGSKYVRLARGSDGEFLKLASNVPSWAAIGAMPEAEAETGTETEAKLISAAVLKAGVEAHAPSPVETFQSADQTITSGGQLTLAHGLSGAPFIVQAFLKCETAELGYSVGDIVPVDIQGQFVSGGVSGTRPGVSIVPDATNITVRFNNASGGVFGLVRKDTGVASTTNNGNWSFFVRAVRFS